MVVPSTATPATVPTIIAENTAILGSSFRCVQRYQGSIAEHSHCAKSYSVCVTTRGNCMKQLLCDHLGFKVCEWTCECAHYHIISTPAHSSSAWEKSADGNCHLLWVFNTLHSLDRLAWFFWNTPTVNRSIFDFRSSPKLMPNAIQIIKLNEKAVSVFITNKPDKSICNWRVKLWWIFKCEDCEWKSGLRM